MDIKHINKLIDKITEKGITEFEMEEEGFRLRISKEPEKQAGNGAVMVQQTPLTTASVQQTAPPQGAADAQEEPQDNSHKITSPMVGTFYSAPSPGAKPYVSVGDKVKKGQVCCIVEAMKIMNEIQSDVDGTITKIHVENEAPVEYGEPLFSVDPA